jgi:hypothetical protein
MIYYENNKLSDFQLGLFLVILFSFLNSTFGANKHSCSFVLVQKTAAADRQKIKGLGVPLHSFFNAI